MSEALKEAQKQLAIISDTIGNEISQDDKAWWPAFDAMDKLESALSRSAGTRDEPGFDEATESRWQKAIYEVCKEAVGPEHYSEIDGAGCDSGDALDFTLTEIRQALDFVRENSRSAPDREETWISIDAQLPPRHQNVLCRNKDGSVFEGRICAGMHKPFFTYPRGDGSPSNTTPTWINVSHWMPVPAMAESPSESAPNPCHDVPRKSAENVPATNSRCDAGGASTAGENPTDGGHLEFAPAPDGGDERPIDFFGMTREEVLAHCSDMYATLADSYGSSAQRQSAEALLKILEDDKTKLPAPEGMGRDTITKFYPAPWTFKEDAYNGGPGIVDAKGNCFVTIFWALHSPEETEQADAATFSLGRKIASLAHPTSESGTNDLRFQVGKLLEEQGEDFRLAHAELLDAYHAMEAESGTDGKSSIEIVDLLTNVAQLLDVIKGEWGDEWSAWDQEQRDAITKHLMAYHYPDSGRSGDKQVLCAARHSDTGPNDPQDCDWPFCGCDPKADKVIEAIEKSGFKIVKAESGRVEEQEEAVLRRISEYRSGYSCGYSDAKNGTRMRDKDAAEVFFRSEIEDGTIPDVFVDEQPLGNCETPHFLGEPTLDRKALTQQPHYELPQGLCKNWVASHSQSSVKEK